MHGQAETVEYLLAFSKEARPAAEGLSKGNAVYDKPLLVGVFHHARHAFAALRVAGDGIGLVVAQREVGAAGQCLASVEVGIADENERVL